MKKLRPSSRQDSFLRPQPSTCLCLPLEHSLVWLREHPGPRHVTNTLLCAPSPPAELPSSEHLSVADATWLALNVVSGGGSFSSSQPIGVTKIAKSVIAPLADQNISVFMLSTYQTDFILVSQSRGDWPCTSPAFSM